LAATLPPDHAFVPGDLGSTSVAGIVFRTAGTQSLSAADTLTPSMAGTQSGISVISASAVSLSVAGLVSPGTAGAPGSVTVTALDSFGNTATGYLGTVSFTSSDAQAVLPQSTTFASTDAGTRAFAVTLKTVGTQSITATDTATASITGT